MAKAIRELRGGAQQKAAQGILKIGVENPRKPRFLKRAA